MILRLFDIAIKDLTRSFRSLTGVIFMLVIPLLVTGMFYLLFGNIAQSGDFDLPRTSVVVANLDRGGTRLRSNARIPGGLRADTLGGLVVEVLKSEDLADLITVSEVAEAASAYRQVDERQAQVAIIIPADFSRQFADLYGQAQIEFYQDPTLTISPGIVRSILNQFMDGMSGVKIAVDVAMDQMDSTDFPLIETIVQEYLATSITQVEDLSGELLVVQSPRKDLAAQGSASPLMRIITPIMGGMMVFYAFYTGAATAESIVREDQERTLPRLFTTPTPQAVVLGGKFLSVFLTVLVQVSVLLVAGRIIFGIYWGQPLPVAIFALEVVLCAASFGIFVNSLIKDTRQSGVIFGGVLTITGMVGMIRIFALNAPGAAILGNTVSLLTPQGWAVRGFLHALNSDALTAVLVTALVCCTWSTLFMGLGVWRFSRRYA